MSQTLWLPLDAVTVTAGRDEMRWHDDVYTNGERFRHYSLTGHDQRELDSVLRSPVRPIANRRPDLPAAVARVIHAALSNRLRERPAEATAFRHVLDAATNGDLAR
jgi:hypothetical protein